MTELTVHQPTASTDLTIADEQGSFTDMQVQALRHLGVEGAGPGDLAVFFHVVKRTGLDPFARQIYMIGRRSQGETKQTIQTGIDGYRLIGRRATAKSGETLSVSAPEWMDENGAWRPVWAHRRWGLPLAARVTIHRDSQPFVAVANFDEYAQTKRDGDLTQMWAQRPAGQIAKCAEALAWRMAFPQDLAGIYTEDEMGQADAVERGRGPVAPGRAALVAAVSPTHVVEQEPEPALAADTAEPDRTEPDGPTPAQTRKMGALTKGMSRDERVEYTALAIRRAVDSWKDVTKAEAGTVIDALERGVDLDGMRAEVEAESQQPDDADYAAGSPDGSAES